ncbi:MAG: hypothetical protein R3185_04855, partial [Candidatus Thermoplasmatota archaeon]|nr:hypothetical protein [Candidatus Thermoplasmatota archaeon]
GYYTIRAQADGYFQNALNAEISDGETRELTVELQNGTTQYGYCCYYAMERGVAMDGAESAPAMGSDDAQAGGSSSTQRAVPEGQPAAPEEGQDLDEEKRTFAGTGGGLGPYTGASSQGTGDPSEPGTPGEPAETPLPSLLGMLAVLSLGAVASRFWRRG